jgi:hypothetical protein
MILVSDRLLHDLVVNHFVTSASQRQPGYMTGIVSNTTIDLDLDRDYDSPLDLDQSGTFVFWYERSIDLPFLQNLLPFVLEF